MTKLEDTTLPIQLDDSVFGLKQAPTNLPKRLATKTGEIPRVPANYLDGKKQIVRPPGCPFNPDSQQYEKIIFSIQEAMQIHTDAVHVAVNIHRKDAGEQSINKAQLQALIYAHGLKSLAESYDVDLVEYTELARQRYREYAEINAEAINAYLNAKLLSGLT